MWTFFLETWNIGVKNFSDKLCFALMLFVWWWQAKSPIKSLDELTVVEMPLTPSFPSIVDQQQITCSSRESLSCSDKIATKSPVAPGNSDQHKIEHSLGEVISQGFGGRRTHHCLVVTARSRSFLYHQVSLCICTFIDIVCRICIRFSISIPPYSIVRWKYIKKEEVWRITE